MGQTLTRFLGKASGPTYNLGDYVAILCDETLADTDEDDEESDNAATSPATLPPIEVDHGAPQETNEAGAPPTSDTVTPPEEEEASSLEGCGIAKVLECRASDAESVWLRIVWLYRPEDAVDLGGEGRMPWHGTNELIASNHMQLVEAVNCNGKVNVKEWKVDATADLTSKDFVWRQTLDILAPPKQRFSKIETYCVCAEPADLSKGLSGSMVQCTNPACAGWLHTACLCEAAEKKAQEAIDAKKAQEDADAIPAPSAPQPLVATPAIESNADSDEAEILFNPAPNGNKGILNSFTRRLTSLVSPRNLQGKMTLPDLNAAAIDSDTEDTTRKANGKAKSRISDLGGVTTTITATPIVGSHLIELDIGGQQTRVPMKCLFCDSPLATKEAKMMSDTKKGKETNGTNGANELKEEKVDINVDTVM
jgi:hypothetical protein